MTEFIAHPTIAEIESFDLRTLALNAASVDPANPLDPMGPEWAKWNDDQAALAARVFNSPLDAEHLAIRARAVT